MHSGAVILGRPTSGQLDADALDRNVNSPLNVRNRNRLAACVYPCGRREFDTHPTDEVLAQDIVGCARNLRWSIAQKDFGMHSQSVGLRRAVLGKRRGESRRASLGARGEI